MTSRMSTDAHAHMLEEAVTYLLGELPPDEAAALEAHLQLCTPCRAELGDLREALNLLADGVPAADPPPELKRRIMRRLRRRRPFPWPWATAAAASLVAALSFWQAAVWHARYEAQLRWPVHVTAWAMRGVPPAPGAAGSLVWVRQADSNWVQLVVAGLPRTTGKQVYQLWYILDGKPISGGTFTVGASGEATVRAAVPPEVGFQVAAVTLEPQDGDQAPKGPVVLATKE